MKADWENFNPLNNIFELGNLKDSIGSGWSVDNPKYSCLQPGFLKIPIEKYNLYRGGYHSCEDELFYPCPLSIFYVQVNYYKIELIQNYSINPNNFIAKLRLFDNKFVNYVDLDIEFTSKNSYKSKWLCNLINILNLFVERGNSIHEIILDNFKTEIRLNPLSFIDFIEMINCLQFKFYYEDSYIIGKDSSSWHIIEINNLPKNEYLIHLFAKILDGRLDIESNIISIIYNQNHFCGFTSGKEEISIDNTKIEEIKDKLKLNIMNCYDYLKDVFVMLSKKNF